MTLYASNKLIDNYCVSFPEQVGVKDANDLKDLAARSDYCMASYRDGQKGNIIVPGYIISTGFMSSSVLFADVDNTGSHQLSIDECMKLLDKYEFYLSTSRNHQKEKNGLPAADRYHLLFPLQEEITDPQTYLSMMRVLNHKIIGTRYIDQSCISLSRKFFGCPTNISARHEGVSVCADIEAILNSEKDNIKKTKIIQPSRSNQLPQPVGPILAACDKADNLGWFDDYRNWITLGHAMKDAGHEMDHWLRYCHDDDELQLAEKKWESFNPDGRMDGEKYLFNIYRKLVLNDQKVRSGKRTGVWSKR